MQEVGGSNPNPQPLNPSERSIEAWKFRSMEVENKQQNDLFHQS
jgi:hypothetical protein